MTIIAAVRLCGHCGGEIVGRKAAALYCSIQCNNDALTARRSAAKWLGVDPDRPCAACGAPLTGKRPHAVYCSRSCKTRASEGRRWGSGGTSATAEMRRARDRERYAKEAEHRRAYARQYLADNPERMRAIRRRRKGQLRAESFLFTEKDWTRLVARYRGCCAYCGTATPELHREHVVSLARGGRHSVGNILPACPRCNLSKKTRHLSDWRYRVLSRRGGDSPSPSF